MAVSLIGGASGVIANVHTASLGLLVMPVDAVGNPLVRQHGAAVPTIPAGLPIMGQSHGTNRMFRVSRHGTQRIGNDRLLFSDMVSGSIINTNSWTSSSLTMTSTQTSGLLTFNANGTNTTATYTIFNSARNFMKNSNGILRFAARCKVQFNANSVVEMGFGLPTTTTTLVQNGTFLRLNASNQMAGVSANNGVETVTNLGGVGVTLSTSYYNFIIVLNDDSVVYTIEDSVGFPVIDQEVSLPVGTGEHWAVLGLPCFFRVLNTGAASGTAASIITSDVIVVELDLDHNQPYSQQLSSFHRAAIWSPQDFTGSVNLGPGAAPVVITPSNTVAGITRLGGEYLTAATGASENLLSVFTYTVPQPWQLKVTGIQIAPPINLGAVVATTNTIIEWAIIANNGTVSIAGTGGARVALPGWHTINIGSPIQQVYSGSIIAYAPITPIVTDPGKVFHVAYKVLAGTATASQQLRGQVLIDGYFE